jgi:hypothetical protein
MNLLYKPASLTEWLQIATDGLAVPGRERVREEIGTHFAEAVKAHLAQGETEPVAQINALEELGDAKTAQRNFRKRHLTKEEEKWLTHLGGMARSKFVLASNLLIGLSLSIDLPWTNSKTGLLFCLPILLLFVALPIYAFYKLRRPGNASKLSLMLVIQFFGFSPFLGVIVYTTALNANRLLNIQHGMPLICVLLFWFVSCAVAFQTWRKIRRYEKYPAIGT